MYVPGPGKILGSAHFNSMLDAREEEAVEIVATPPTVQFPQLWRVATF